MLLPSSWTCRAIASMVALLCLAPAARGQETDDDIANEFRITAFPSYELTERTVGFGYLGYVQNPDLDYSNYYLGTGLAYSPMKWLQLWAGLIGNYTDNEDKSDRLELRPFVGVKSFLPNDLGWRIYNFTRVEYRLTQDFDDHDWSDTYRLRSRFGVEIPLTAKESAWDPKTWYVLADVEPIYRFDRSTIDPLRLRTGVGYVLNDHIAVELQYTAQFTRRSSSSLEFSDNIFRLNFKISREKGLLKRLFGPALDD